MNKAFVKEPEFDGRAYCPRCGSLGSPVGSAALDHHLTEQSRPRMSDSAWFCGFASCDVAYFDLFESVIEVRELPHAVYPMNEDAPICACFGFTQDDVDADVQEGTPTRIRELLAKSKSSEAECSKLAADGQCCIREVQFLYVRQTTKPDE